MKTFYQFVMTFRGRDDSFAYFAEAAFEDQSFPKQSIDFNELSEYVEMCQDEYMTTAVFDALWALYV
ncbi:YozE family protein [Metalysinibacillus jejuensis]|uniref:YozE family protein n=1 Tax=Metalysinibacillus jejuensis TaxID=914327 RepID=UPI000D39F546|nr:YozE family protein [Metalysinibacillus jejuensis]